MINYIILEKVTTPFEESGGEVVFLPKFLTKSIDISSRRYKRTPTGKMLYMEELQGKKNHC